MDTDRLSKLPIDLFIKELTYLPFDSVISVCQNNTTLHNYCIDPKYNTNWKLVTDNTFSSIDNYHDKLKETWSKMMVPDNTYNYLVYTHLVKLLDPITQLMIYYRQGDIASFNDPKFDKSQRFLSMFLLNNINGMKDHFPDDSYLPFINLLENKKVNIQELIVMLFHMVQNGNIKGVKIFLEKGADDDILAATGGYVLQIASKYGQLNVVKYIIGVGVDVHVDDDEPLIVASKNGYLDIVKYLISKRADIHAQNEESLRGASKKGYLDIVKYLVENGADVHARNDDALRLATRYGHLEVIKYLESLK